MSRAALRVGCWSFTATGDPVANAAEIRRGIAAAASDHVRVLLTPECALTGYPGAARADLVGIDGCGQGDLEERLLAEADKAGVVLVLGTAAPDGAGGYTNDAVALGGRYRKRCLTPGDELHFVAGTKSASITVDGWRLGLAICYDLRFPDVWRDLAQADTDANLVIAHMAGPDTDPGTKAQVVPAFCSVRAAESATPLVFCNTAAADRWLDSGAWDARGVRTASAATGLLAVDLASRDTLHPWYAGLRAGYRARS